jgi:serine/threonine protein kinase
VICAVEAHPVSPHIGSHARNAAGGGFTFGRCAAERDRHESLIRTHQRPTAVELFKRVWHSPLELASAPTILAPIGAGGMGEVWKARDTRLNRTVAIKVARQAFSERFEREARATSR